MRSEASGSRSVAVAGDVRSSIIVTGDNVNLEVRLDDVDGALLERLASRDTPEPLVLPRPLDSRPPRFANHVDREAEAVAALAGAAKVGAVNVYGEPGIGKTHVLSNAAHRPEADELPDGVVFVQADGAPLDDVLQALFEEFYDCGEPPVRPSRGRLRRSLSDHEALVVLDGLELDREGGQALVAAAPSCRFVAASTERCLWDAQAIRLEGLEPEFALALVEQELGRALAPDERLDAESLCRSLGGHPWRVREAVSRARDQGRTLAEAARSLDPGAPLEALTSGERSVLAALAAVGGGPVALDRLRELAPVEDVQGTLADLERRHLVESHSPRYSLAEPLLAEVERRVDLEPVREHALAQYLSWAERNRDEPDAVARERPALLSLLRWASASRRDADAIRLGRAVDPGFAGAGRFGSWGEAVDHVLRAARESRDPHAEAWALHQRGTRAVSVDESPAGRADLEEALRLRQALGDHRGAAVTQHNLEVLRTPPWYAKLGWGPLTILAIAVVLIAAAAGGALAYREFTGDDEATPTTTTEPTTTESNTTVLVTVPGVVGDPVRAARAELEELGLEVRVTRTPSDEEPAGIVLEQDPEEGEEVEEGSRVALIVSSGPEQVEVPDVVGDPVEVATKELEGFEVTETEAPSAQFDAGIVAAQNPDGGTLVDPGSDVEITVSTGGPPDLDVGITDFSSCQSLEPTCTTIHFVVRTVNGVPLPGAIPIRIVSRLVESDPVEVTDELEPENDGATEESFTQEIECDPKGCLLTVEVDPERTLDDPDYANNTATYPDVE